MQIYEIGWAGEKEEIRQSVYPGIIVISHELLKNLTTMILPGRNVMHKIAAFAVLLIGLTACENADHGIEISWTDSGVVTYHYGSSPGWTWSRGFSVAGEKSGDMKVSATCNDNELSCTEFDKVKPSGIDKETSPLSQGSR